MFAGIRNGIRENDGINEDHKDRKKQQGSL